MSTQLVPTEREDKSEIGQLIQVAIEKDLDIEKLRTLLEMKREQDELERSLKASEAFLEAHSAFLGECPLITADKKGGGGGGPKWNYPSLGRILSVALPIMSKYGLSYSHNPDFENEMMCCTLKHTLGHKEHALFPMTLEGQNEKAVGSLTLQQKWAHALTFAERQSFKAVTGVPTSDDDVDALKAANSPPENLIRDLKKAWWDWQLASGKATTDTPKDILATRWNDFAGEIETTEQLKDGWSRLTELQKEPRATDGPFTNEERTDASAVTEEETSNQD